MSTVHEPARETPVHGEFDVVVIGGGPAGLMAAAAAARAGRSTILLERYGFLGGAGTMGGLSTFCGLHAKVHGEHRQVIHGLADEMLERLTKLDGLNEPHLTIADNVAQPLIYRGLAPAVRHERANTALARVGLEARRLEVRRQAHLEHVHFSSGGRKACGSGLHSVMNFASKLSHTVASV